jgi:hypothetical protein
MDTSLAAFPPRHITNILNNILKTLEKFEKYEGFSPGSIFSTIPP